MSQELYPRHAEASLRRLLEISPVVLIHGPRQCGKTTLARMVGDSQGYQYLSFDDPDVLAYATDDPVDFARSLPERCILDEVQKVPKLFSCIKMEVDRERTPGRFILTGSANVYLLPTLSDSLAGRVMMLRLHPLSQTELARQTPRFLDSLFFGTHENWKPSGSDSRIRTQILSGGYPPALALQGEESRATWYRNHIQSIIHRDVRDLARIRSLEIFSKLLAGTAAQTAELYNMNKLATPLEISRPTVQNHVVLLEQMFLLERLYPWWDDHPRRLIKTPKMHLCDTGIACALLDLNSAKLRTRRSLYGHLLETFVFQEIQRQGDGSGTENFSFYRNKNGTEVDIVVQRGHDQLAGIEVKAAGIIGQSDFRGLKVLRRTLGPRFVAGVVLYNGEFVRTFGDRLFAAPIAMLWDTSAQA